MSKSGYTPSEAQRRTMFQKGQSGNPKGMTKEVAQRIQSNARKATELREKFLDTLQSRIATAEYLHEKRVAEGGELSESNEIREATILNLLNSDTNKLMVDSENRALGSPKQDVSMTTRKADPEDMSDEELAALAASEEDEQS